MELIDTFNAELGVLIQRYLDKPEADPAALAQLLQRRAQAVEMIGFLEETEN